MLWSIAQASNVVEHHQALPTVSSIEVSSCLLAISMARCRADSTYIYRVNFRGHITKIKKHLDHFNKLN